MSHDRRDSDTFALKQELLAKMLGVCRPTATVAAGALQRAGLIRYSRGVLTVLDRPGLAVASCECYRVICDHFEQLLPITYGRPLQRAYERPPARSDDRVLWQAFGCVREGSPEPDEARRGAMPRKTWQWGNV
jgi:Crp-like helix-turn-helix domain